MKQKLKFEYQGIDTTFIDLEKANSATRFKVLCPYPGFDLSLALSTKASKKRVKIVDNAILKCLRL